MPTIKVTAAQAHSYNGKHYKVGDSYEIDELYAESVAAQGKAYRADAPKAAKQPSVKAKAPARQTKQRKITRRK
jgi:hypothetical protein